MRPRSPELLTLVFCTQPLPSHHQVELAGFLFKGHIEKHQLDFSFGKSLDVEPQYPVSLEPHTVQEVMEAEHWRSGGGKEGEGSEIVMIRLVQGRDAREHASNTQKAQPYQRVFSAKHSAFKITLCHSHSLGSGLVQQSTRMILPDLMLEQGKGINARWDSGYRHWDKEPLLWVKSHV